MAAKPCPHCGRDIGAWLTFCPACGEAFKERRQKKEPAPAERPTVSPTVYPSMPHQVKCPECFVTVPSSSLYCPVCGVRFEARETARLIGSAVYVGGHPSMGPARSEGHLCIASDWIGLSGPDGGPKDALSLALRTVASVDVVDGPAIKSNVGQLFTGYAVAGPIGALVFGGGADLRDKVAVTLHARDGDSAYFVVVGKTQMDVRAALAPYLKSAGVPFHDAVTASPTGSHIGIADELAKLTGLRERGVLTEDEFAAQKARLLT